MNFFTERTGMLAAFRFQAHQVLGQSQHQTSQVRLAVMGSEVQEDFCRAVGAHRKGHAVRGV